MSVLLKSSPTFLLFFPAEICILHLDLVIIVYFVFLCICPCLLFVFSDDELQLADHLSPLCCAQPAFSEDLIRDDHPSLWWWQFVNGHLRDPFGLYLGVFLVFLGCISVIQTYICILDVSLKTCSFSAKTTTTTKWTRTTKNPPKTSKKKPKFPPKNGKNPFDFYILSFFVII